MLRVSRRAGLGRIVRDSATGAAVVGHLQPAPPRTRGEPTPRHPAGRPARLEPVEVRGRAGRSLRELSADHRELLAGARSESSTPPASTVSHDSPFLIPLTEER